MHLHSEFCSRYSLVFSFMLEVGRVPRIMMLFGGRELYDTLTTQTTWNAMILKDLKLIG